jgi:hypothetical protein
MRFSFLFPGVASSPGLPHGRVQLSADETRADDRAGRQTMRAADM